MSRRNGLAVALDFDGGSEGDLGPGGSGGSDDDGDLRRGGGGIFRFGFSLRGDGFDLALAFDAAGEEDAQGRAGGVIDETIRGDFHDEVGLIFVHEGDDLAARGDEVACLGLEEADGSVDFGDEREGFVFEFEIGEFLLELFEAGFGGFDAAGDLDFLGELFGFALELCKSVVAHTNLGNEGRRFGGRDLRGSFIPFGDGPNGGVGDGSGGVIDMAFESGLLHADLEGFGVERLSSVVEFDLGAGEAFVELGALDGDALLDLSESAFELQILKLDEGGAWFDDLAGLHEDGGDTGFRAGIDTARAGLEVTDGGLVAIEGAEGGRSGPERESDEDPGEEEGLSQRGRRPGDRSSRIGVLEVGFAHFGSQFPVERGNGTSEGAV